MSRSDKRKEHNKDNKPVKNTKKGIKKLQNQARNKVFGKDTKSLQHS